MKAHSTGSHQTPGIPARSRTAKNTLRAGAHLPTDQERHYL